MKEKNISDMKQRENLMSLAMDDVKVDGFKEDPAKEMLVRKQIGKQTYFIRVHFREDGADNLQAKICRLLGDEIRSSKYTKTGVSCCAK